MFGLMVENTLDNGLIIKWMEGEYLIGLMVNNMLDSIIMIKKMEEEN